MKLWRASLSGMLVAIGLTDLGLGQAIPPAPPLMGAGPLALPGVAAPGIASSAAAGAAAGAAAAPARTIWGFFGLSKANLRACRDHLCTTQLGQMLNSMTTPMSGLTGGIVPSLCPPLLGADELAALQALPPEMRGPEAVAAMVQADEAAAKARVAAVEYLGTVDCHYWPEATDVLIASLRADRNECVRFAAARVLATGCCCNKLTIEALTISAMGTDKDGNPSEKSPRVRTAAQIALHTCVMAYKEPVEPVEPEPLPVPVPEQPEILPEVLPETDGVELGRRPTATAAVQPSAAEGDGVRLTAYYRQVRTKPSAQVLADARQALAALSRRPPEGMVTGQRSLYHAFVRASEPDAHARAMAGPPPAMPPAQAAPAGRIHPIQAAPVGRVQGASSAGTYDRQVVPSSAVRFQSPPQPLAPVRSTAPQPTPARQESGRSLLQIFSDSRRQPSR